MSPLARGLLTAHDRLLYHAYETMAANELVTDVDLAALRVAHWLRVASAKAHRRAARKRCTQEQ